MESLNNEQFSYDSISRARVIVQEDGNFNFQILLQSKESGKLETVDEFYRLCEMMTSKQYKFCPGIDADMYEATYFSIQQEDGNGTTLS